MKTKGTFVDLGKHEEFGERYQIHFVVCISLKFLFKLWLTFKCAAH